MEGMFHGGWGEGVRVDLGVKVIHVNMCEIVKGQMKDIF